MSPIGSTRSPSAVDALADRYLLDLAAADPILATGLGLGKGETELTDFSPEAIDDRLDLGRRLLSDLAAAGTLDRVDAVTVATMTASLRRELALGEAGELVGVCNVIASPLQEIRDVFDLMPTDSPDQRAAVVQRLAAVPTSLRSAIAGLERRLQTGPPPARRQVEQVARQADRAITSIEVTLGAVTDPALAADLDLARRRAGEAFEGFAAYLRDRVLGVSVADDAVGRDRYLLALPHFLGADMAPEEAYRWGQEALAGIIAEQQRIADDLVPGQGIAAAVAWLDAQPQYRVTDRHAFVDWMQETSDAAVTSLAGTHFDIPDRLTRLECRLAPSATGIIYYTQPSADLTRPGRMWWSVPPGQQVFHTWREKTTVYHEGVPGHHLQLGAAISDPALNSWRRLASFTSGHGEGWALYAERLMADLGYLDDPGDRMGMLDAQRLRAVRVVLDIGVHCRLAAPPSLGGGIWDADKAWRLLTESVSMDRDVLAFELDRYLGWPGQAPSYALGQRVWEQTRDAALAAHPDWSLRDFHSRALALGGVSLDVLADELTGRQPA